MDGWAQTYYRTEEDYKQGTNKVLPYAVNCKEHKRISILTKALNDAGFTYACTFTGTPSLMTSFLVNTEFKIYAKVPYPVGYNCVNDRVYTIEEFFEEMSNRNMFPAPNIIITK